VNTLKIKDTNINYVQYGNKTGKDIVLLHGWGQNIEMMDPIGRRLQDDFKITIVDLPGFGDSPEPPFGWTIHDYYEAVDELLTNLKIKKPIIIGHSFGGRIAIMYAASKPVTKLILLASPFRRTNKKATLNMKILKFMKKVPIINKLENYMKTKIGSRDYRNATPVMRKILVNVINENLIDYLPKIKCSTLLIWGSNDEEVPLKEADYMKTVIKDSGLVVYDGCTHFAYLERLDQTINIINSFLKDEKKDVNE
jgi:pimeloyl-ACP methyl ester carboxylesterase